MADVGYTNIDGDPRVGRTCMDSFLYIQNLQSTTDLFQIYFGRVRDTAQMLFYLLSRLSGVVGLGRLCILELGSDLC